MRGQEIKPIETEYNGYRFRSRLEARWAVFYDKAGIPYQYEPEGFVLEDGTHYLPDFYLPWFNAYVEVKQREKEAVEKGYENLWKLFRGKSDCICILNVGNPWEEDNMGLICNSHDCFGNLVTCYFSSIRFLEGCWWDDEDGYHGTSKHWVSLVADSYGNKKDKYFDKDGNLMPVYSDYCLAEYRSDFNYAKEAAKEARFEHGETPNAKLTIDRIKKDPAVYALGSELVKADAFGKDEARFYATAFDKMCASRQWNTSEVYRAIKDEIYDLITAF